MQTDDTVGALSFIFLLHFIWNVSLTAKQLNSSTTELSISLPFVTKEKTLSLNQGSPR